MTRLKVDSSALLSNINVIEGWMSGHGAGWTLVTKVLCGEQSIVRLLIENGIKSIGDSRIVNLKAVHALNPDVETWYLRPPHLSGIDSITQLADISLNSEIAAIQNLSNCSGKLGRTHRIVIMIELGDLREGILPGSLTHFYERVFELPAIEVIGIGSNLGCLSGAIPTTDNLMQLVLYRELLELKFGRKLPLISAGSTAVLPLLSQGKVPRAINHFRIGEAAFLGTDLLNGGILSGLRNDVFILEAEICEIKEKSLASTTEVGDISPYGKTLLPKGTPGQTGLRAILNIGQLDTEVAGLTPVDPRHQVAGASSDLTVVNINDSAEGLKVGDTIRLRLSYAALLRLMSTNYIPKVLV
jgi:predicted amino acid racemase